MATHSSILPWKIPWTEEPGGLQSMGLQESDTTKATEHACGNPGWRARGSEPGWKHQE